MTGEPGTIVELDRNDALGWIALDSGGKVRFGGTSFTRGGFGPDTGVGTRVTVHGTRPDHRGHPRALEVRLLAAAPPTPPPAPQRPAPIPWPTFVHTHPRWSDVADLCAAPRTPAPPPRLPPHPLFTPWHEELCASAPTVVQLTVPTHHRQSPLDPTPADSFAHGRTAYLEQPRWPACGACERPLEMCIQLAPATLAAFIPDGRGLAALSCFHCAPRTDRQTTHIEFTSPRHRVTCPPDAPASASSGWLSTSQRVTAGPPVTMVPTFSFLRYRSPRAPSLAASRLFGFGAAALTGPFPPGTAPHWLDDLGLQYDSWISRGAEPTRWTGARLGGFPEWDQSDRTPSCPHGEMQHLLAYNGGQFLDGALHIFLCRQRTCPPTSVAEF